MFRVFMPKAPEKVKILKNIILIIFSNLFGYIFYHTIGHEKYRRHWQLHFSCSTSTSRKVQCGHHKKNKKKQCGHHQPRKELSGRRSSRQLSAVDLFLGRHQLAFFITPHIGSFFPQSISNYCIKSRLLLKILFEGNNWMWI